MKRVIAVPRRSFQLLVLLALGASLSQANTISWYADIFSGVGFISAGGTPLTGAQLLADAQSATSKNLPYSATIALPAFSVTPPAGFFATLQSVTFQLATAETSQVDSTNTSPTQAYSFTNLMATVPITISGSGLGAGLTNTLTAGPENGTVPVETFTFTPVFSDTALTGTNSHGHPIYFFGDSSANPGNPDLAASLLAWESAADITSAPIPVCNASDAVAAQIVSDGYTITAEPNGSITSYAGTGDCNYQSGNTPVSHDGLIDYEGLSSSGLGPLDTVNTGLGAFLSGALSYTFNSSITVGANCCTPVPPQNVVNFGGSGFGGGEVQVTFNYTLSQVPEPTSMVLIGSSILGLGLLLRRKARKS